MSEFGESIKIVYQKFIMRDLFSFFTPGVIVFMSVLYLVESEQSSIIYDLQRTPASLYVPLIGFCYVIGISLQFVGHWLGLAKIHHYGKWEEHLNSLSKFYRMTRNANDIRDQHERFVFLKQACGNNALALIAAIPLVAIKLGIRIFSQFNWLAILLMGFVIVILLRVQRENLDRQEIWENLHIAEDNL